jgi:uncharacterized protein
MSIVAIYAALLGLLFAGLSFRTIRLRRTLKVGLGTGDHPALARAIRAHGHFAEYVPMALLLIGFAHASGASSVVLNIWGAALLLGRCLHCYGLSQVEEDYRFRVTGMMLTMLTIISSSIFILTRH